MLCSDMTEGIGLFISTEALLASDGMIPEGRLCANMPIVMRSPVKVEGSLWTHGYLSISLGLWVDDERKGQAGNNDLNTTEKCITNYIT